MIRPIKPANYRMTKAVTQAHEKPVGLFKYKHGSNKPWAAALHRRKDKKRPITLPEKA